MTLTTIRLFKIQEFINLSKLQFQKYQLIISLEKQVIQCNQNFLNKIIFHPLKVDTQRSNNFL